MRWRLDILVNGKQSNFYHYIFFILESKRNMQQNHIKMEKNQRCFQKEGILTITYYKHNETYLVKQTNKPKANIIVG